MPVKARWPQHLLRYAACLVATGLVVQVYGHLIHVNPTTVALTFLRMVLWVAAYGDFALGFSLCLITLAFNYYFLPPIGTLTVADRRRVALFAFADRGHRQPAAVPAAKPPRAPTSNASTVQRRLLATDNVAELLNAIPPMSVTIRRRSRRHLPAQLPNRFTAPIPKATSLALQDLQMVSSRGVGAHP